jgi:hypothetical protein
MFVSRRTLPGIRIDLFAAFLDGARHGVEIGGINAASEAQEILARCSDGLGQAAREIQDLALVRSVQAVDLLDDLVFDGLCHNEINVGKGMFDVKGDILTPLFRGRTLLFVAQQQKAVVLDFHEGVKLRNLIEFSFARWWGVGLQ